MSNDLAISVEHVGKAYRIWESPASRLTAPALAGLAGMLPRGLAARLRGYAESRHRDFCALRYVSFEVRKGEAVGIIGRNGSGKSTLLQIIAGTMQPTSGSVRVNGRVAAMLELGSGFNPEFTGRENVYLNAAVLGLTRAETSARFDAIAAFADIGEFLDQPVKTYSTGMMMRLAFAVSVCVQPDILIVDEALSVGDVFFQQKCFKRIHELLEGDTSFLFVSHDTAAVQNLCDRAILLVAGEQVYTGPPEEAVSRYFTLGSSRSVFAEARSVPVEAAAVPTDLKADILAHDILVHARSRHGSGELRIVAASFRNENRLPAMLVRMGQRATIQVLIRANKTVATPNIGLHLFDRMNNLVFATGSRQLGAAIKPFAEGEERVIQLVLEFAVQPGDYTFSLGCAEPSPDGPNVGFLHDRHESIGPVTVHADSESVYPFYGIARLPMEITECR